MPKPRDERLDLSVENAVLLWCMRSWVADMGQPAQAGQRIGEMLGRLGAEHAGPYVEGLMFAVGHGAERRVGVQCVGCPRIGPDERLLLDCIALAQAHRPFEALLSLREILSSEGARAALRSAEGIGGALACAQRFLPTPEIEVRRAVFASRERLNPDHATTG